MQPVLPDATTVCDGAGVGLAARVGEAGWVAAGPAAWMGVAVGTAVAGDPQAAKAKARIKNMVIR